MPSLSDLSSNGVVKMLLIGDSGAGKTGALCSLVDAGYKLRVLDFDNGLTPLAKFVKNQTLLSNVLFESCQDTLESKGRGQLKLPRGAKAFAHALDCLDEWPGLESGVSEWGDDTILVLDSLTFASKAAMTHVMDGIGKFGQQPSQPNWGEAQRYVENLLALLYADSTKCNVIVTSHLKYIGDEATNSMRGYPESLGKSLSPTIPRYFDVMVMARTTGSGTNRRKVLLTQSTNMVDLKVPAKLEEELPQETGLATIFQTLRGRAHPGD